MPHLTSAIGTQGPLLSVTIGISSTRWKALAAADPNATYPQPIVLRALLDTGASCTCVDPSKLQLLGQSPTGVIDISTPSTGSVPVQCYQYDVGLMLYDADYSRMWDSVPVISAELAVQGIDALIGRDILEKCLVIYDGKAGRFTIAW